MQSNSTLLSSPEHRHSDTYGSIAFHPESVIRSKSFSIISWRGLCIVCGALGGFNKGVDEEEEEEEEEGWGGGGGRRSFNFLTTSAALIKNQTVPARSAANNFENNKIKKREELTSRFFILSFNGFRRYSG